MKPNNKPSSHVASEIKLKNGCLLATKSDIDYLDFSKSVCYAFVCKEALFSFEDVPSSLPPAVTNILQEFTDIFPQDVPLGLPPIRGIEHQVQPNNKPSSVAFEIKLKSGCLLATKSDIDDLDFSKFVCYAFVCKE